MTTSSKSSAAAGAAEDKQRDGGPAKVAEVADTTAAELAALRAELDAMRAERDASKPAPAPEVVPQESQDPTHVHVLACGDSVKLPNTIATHFHCPEHDATVPVTGVYALAS